MRRLRGRAFSLAELLVSISLVSLVMVVGILNLQSSLNSSHSQGLAQVVAAELRAALQSAIAAQVPVAVGMPSANATLPCSRSLYVASGRSRAHVVSTRDFAGDFPRALLFQGLWPLSSGSNGVTPPNFGLNQLASLNLDSWLPGSLRTDHCLIFLPTGNVISNGLPLFDGAYHWVSATGVDYSPTSLAGAPTPAPPYFAPTRIGQPWTITVTTLGQITVTKGLRGQDGSVDQAEQAPSGAIAPPANPETLGPSNPALNQISALPRPPVDGLPPGINISVVEDRRASLRVTANDPSARDLFAQWSADGGNFTITGPERMTWDDASQRWISAWEWFPPPGALPGEDFHLTCSLGDGVNATVLPGATQDIVITPISPITFVYASADRIVRVNSDGTNRVETGASDLFSLGSIWRGSVSADGTRSLAGGAFGFALIGPDGTVLSKFTAGAATMHYDWWLSPYARKVISLNLYGGPIRFNLSVMNADGSGETLLPVPGNSPSWNPVGTRYRFDVCSWSPDETQVLYRRNDTTPSRLCLVNVTGGSEQVLPLSETQVGTWSVNWARDGFLYYNDPVSDLPWRIRPDGSAAAPIPLATPPGLFPVKWSIDSTCSQMVMIMDNDEVWVQNINGTNARHLVQVQDGANIASIHWGN